MTTDCIPHQFEFQGMTRRTVVAAFDGGTLSSDGGVLLLAEVDRRLGLLELFATCFQGPSKSGPRGAQYRGVGPPACVWAGSGL